MKKISRLLNYLADYKGKIGLYFLFNLLSILFGLFSFTLIIPVLNVLFNNPLTSAGPGVPVNKGLPTGFFGQQIDMAKEYFNNLLLNHDKLTTLAYICFIVVIFTVLKNLFLYLALYVLNPLRNAVLRRLRDDLFTKTLSLPIGFFTEER